MLEIKSQRWTSSNGEEVEVRSKATVEDNNLFFRH